MLLFSHKVVSDSFATPWTVAHQPPLSMEFSRQEYWSWQPPLFQRIFPTQWSNLGLLHCRQILKHQSHQGSPYLSIYLSIYILFQILQLGFQPRGEPPWIVSLPILHIASQIHSTRRGILNTIVCAIFLHEIVQSPLHNFVWTLPCISYHKGVLHSMHWSRLFYKPVGAGCLHGVVSMSNDGVESYNMHR